MHHEINAHSFELSLTNNISSLYPLQSLASQMKVENKEGKEKRRLDRRVKRMIAGMDKIIDRLQKDRLKHAQNLKKRVEEVETAAFKVGYLGIMESFACCVLSYFCMLFE